MNNVKNIAMALMGFFLLGWGPVMKKSADASDEAQAKLFMPDSTHALVYVFRDKSLLGRSATSELVVNNKTVTENKSGQFSVVSLSPGKYDLFSVSSGGSNTAATLIHNAGKKAIPLNAEAGQIYYFQEIFKPAGGFSLTPMSPEKAQPLIKKGKLRALHKL